MGKFIGWLMIAIFIISLFGYTIIKDGKESLIAWGIALGSVAFILLAVYLISSDYGKK